MKATLKRGGFAAVVGVVTLLGGMLVYFDTAQYRAALHQYASTMQVAMNAVSTELSAQARDIELLNSCPHGPRGKDSGWGPKPECLTKILPKLKTYPMIYQGVHAATLMPAEGELLSSALEANSRAQRNLGDASRSIGAAAPLQAACLSSWTMRTLRMCGMNRSDLENIDGVMRQWRELLGDQALVLHSIEGAGDA